MDCDADVLFDMGFGFDEGSEYVSELIHDDSNRLAFEEENGVQVVSNDEDHQLFSHIEGMLKTVQANIADDEEPEAGVDRIQSNAKKVGKPKYVPKWTEEDGTRRPTLPHQSYWYNVYVAHPDVGSASFQRKFRFRFRLPYAQFIELEGKLGDVAAFGRWHNGRINPWTRQATAPISLLLLAALRYLGRGWTFDDLAENTAISQEVLRVFFHAFIDYGSTVLYQLYIRPPRTSWDARVHSAEYEIAGFPGAVGSSDATHILLERVSYRFRQTHIGFKMSHTARSYNITVNHRRQIIATTSGHPARWNDKTLALFDDFMQELHEGNIMDDNHFQLYAYDSDGEVTKQDYRGAWLLVDNGYLAWSTTVPPIKTTTSRAEIRFSAWLESMRKDVECTFGILKGRWRILKTGIRLFGTHSADKIFLTCCALHNWLLEIDGLHERWAEGEQSEWEDPLGNHERDAHHDVSRAVVNLQNPADARSYGASAFGLGNDIAGDDGDMVLSPAPFLLQILLLVCRMSSKIAMLQHPLVALYR
jgi:hypothetical protein